MADTREPEQTDNVFEYHFQWDTIPILYDTGYTGYQATCNPRKNYRLELPFALQRLRVRVLRLWSTMDYRNTYIIQRIKTINRKHIAETKRGPRMFFLLFAGAKGDVG